MLLLIIVFGLVAFKGIFVPRNRAELGGGSCILQGNFNSSDDNNVHNYVILVIHLFTHTRSRLNMYMWSV